MDKEGSLAKVAAIKESFDALKKPQASTFLPVAAHELARISVPDLSARVALLEEEILKLMTRIDALENK